MRYRIAVALAVVFAAGPTFARHHFSQPPSTASYNSHTVVKPGTLTSSTEIQTDAAEPFAVTRPGATNEVLNRTACRAFSKVALSQYKRME